MAEKIRKNDNEWLEHLGPEGYRVLRQEGTERAFTGKYWDFKGKGIYRCAGCDSELFASDTKYESHSGWPSFWQPLATENVEELVDTSHGMRRVEARCAVCEGHLGHVFEDGPQPTGRRYCMNSAALDFVPDEE
jgi:peptide-methionine (R)-S-oxide reductase